MNHPDSYTEDFLNGIVMLHEGAADFTLEQVDDFVRNQKWREESARVFHQVILICQFITTCT